MTEKYKLQQEDINSMDLSSDTLAKLKQILPEVFAEGADGKPSIDVEKLKIALGAAVDIEADEKTRYSFGWSGKKQAQALANQPSNATLRPCQAESKDWDSTQNVYIEGDNLEVLKLLQKSYYGQIKMIYIDPPYNTGKDFVYKDNFHDNVKNYLQLTGQVDNDGNKISTNTDKSGRYHTDWLNMMYPRLKLARNLLKEEGVIFISIDDNEVHNLRKICDEIFGEDNFIGEFIWHSRQNVDSRSLNGASIDHEYVLCYLKSSSARIVGKSIDKNKYKNPDNDPRGPWMSSAMDGVATQDQRPNLHYVIINPKTNLKYAPNPANGWRFQPSTLESLINDNRVIWPKDPSSKPRFKRYLNELSSEVTGFSSILKTDFTSQGTRDLRDIMEMEALKFPKPVNMVKSILEQGASSDCIILDFFSGSATTAHAVMQLNAEDGGKRKYICVQLPETTAPESEAKKAGYKNICEIGKERIRRAGDKVLAEWTEKQQKSALVNAKDGLFAEDAESDIAQTILDIGFKVFKLDTSNIKPFDVNDMFADDLMVADRSALDLFYELVLKQGYSLANRQSVLDIGGTSCYALVHEGGEPFVLAVLDDTVKPNFALELLKHALTLVIVKDACFGTDEIKLNLLATLEQLQTPDNPLQIRIV